MVSLTLAAQLEMLTVNRARTSCSTRGSAMVFRTLAAQLEMLTVSAIVFRTLAAQLETLTVKGLKDELRDKQLPV